MVDDEQIQATRRRHGCAWLSGLCLLAVPLLIVGLWIAWLLASDSTAQEKLQTQLAAIRKAGHPTDSRSLQKYYEQHTDSSDTPAWLRVLAALDNPELQRSWSDVPLMDGFADDRVPLPGQPWASERSTREFLARWRDLYQQILELALKGKAVRFPIVFASSSTLLPHSQQLRTAARFLLLDGQLALRDGDAIRVEQAIRGLWGAAGINSQDPLLVSHMISLAIDGMALELLRDALQTGLLPAERLRELLPEIERGTQLSPSFRVAMIGERATNLPAWLGAQGDRSLPGQAGDALHYLEIMQQMIDAPGEDVEAFVWAFLQHQPASDQSQRASWWSRLGTGQVQWPIPAMQGAIRADIYRMIQYRLAAVACGVRLYQQQHTDFPSQLAQLAELRLGMEHMSAPGNQPFGYRVTPAGHAQLWSFNPLWQTSVPAEPPDTSPGNVHGPENHRWLWQLELPTAAVD